MNKLELNIIDLLQYLQEMLDTSAKMPITGKVMVDKKEFKEVIDQVINYLPDQLKKAEWVMTEKERILSDAQKEFETARKESVELKKQNIENHDIVKDAKIRANEIIALAQRDAKAIRVGSREYSNEILLELDKEIENKKIELIEAMQKSFEKVANEITAVQGSFEKVAKEIDDNLSDTGKVIKENIAELRNM